jgi:hypothetical protein
MKKSIQIKLEDHDYKRIKSRLVEAGLTWQSWGEAKALEILSESLDGFGIPIMEMAFSRSDFQNKIQEKLIGALGEYAFIVLAKKNRQTKWVKHKSAEVDHLLLQLVDVFEFATKGKFSKTKAASEAIEYYRDRLESFVTRSMNSYQRYYGKRPAVLIITKDIEPFLDRALSALPQGW